MQPDARSVSCLPLRCGLPVLLAPRFHNPGTCLQHCNLAHALQAARVAHRWRELTHKVKVAEVNGGISALYHHHPRCQLEGCMRGCHRRHHSHCQLRDHLLSLCQLRASHACLARWPTARQPQHCPLQAQRPDDSMTHVSGIAGGWKRDTQTEKTTLAGVGT
eukprot:1340570-Rhodomonas_salina.1